MSSTKGQIVAQWHVFCNLCSEHCTHTLPRTTSFTEAKRHFRELGWKEGKRFAYMGGTLRLWICPDCNRNTGNFLSRCKKLPPVKVDSMSAAHKEAHAKKKLNRKLYS